MSTDQGHIVEVPEYLCPLNDYNLALLQQSVDFRIDDGNFGINLYNDTVAEVTRLLEVQRPCSL